MRRSVVLVTGYLFVVAIGHAQLVPGTTPDGLSRHAFPRVVDVTSHDPGFKTTSARSFYSRKSEWQKIIDSTWGPGLPLSQKLSVFDYYSGYIRAVYPTFAYTNLNWDSVSAYWRAKITVSTSQGGFSAILSHLARQLDEGHAWAWDNIMVTTPLNPGTPILVNLVSDGRRGAVSHFGAGLTAMPDSSLLVYMVVANHPLGLKPGDIVLGYEGIPWRMLVRELMDAGLPTVQYNACSPSARERELLLSAGMNWHLFDTIDVVKYGTGDTLHLSTDTLVTLKPVGGLVNGAQLPVPGVPMPGWVFAAGGSMISDGVTYGIVHGTNVGYIYVYHHMNDNVGALFDAAVAALSQTHGLIIDIRFDQGGWSGLNAGIARLTSFAGVTLQSLTRASGTDLRTVVPASTLNFTIPQDNVTYGYRVAVLTGPTCASYGDLTLRQLTYLNNVRFFGESPEADYGGMWWGQPQATGFNLECPDFTVVDQHSPTTQLWGKEFPLDEEVWLTRDGVANGRDDVVERALAWIPTGIVSGESQVPGRFALSQNYPNPFNPGTTIKFELPEASHVSLTVYDLLGREVSVLVNERRVAGVHEVRFDGSKLASGVYFYRLLAGGFVQSRSLVLLR